MKFFALLALAPYGTFTGVVNEVLPEFFTVDGVSYPLEERYHPTFISWLLECPEGTVQGATFDGTTWTNPEPQEAPDATD